LLEGPRSVLTSELTAVELTSAASAAVRAGRIPDPSRLLRVMDADMGSGGPVVLILLRPDAVLPHARRLLLEHSLRTLDAIHLAVAVLEAPALASDGKVELVTRDEPQAAAARALGLTVR
jgi:predicted nucleic acid-binding protein